MTQDGVAVSLLSKNCELRRLSMSRTFTSTKVQVIAEVKQTIAMCKS